MKKRIHPCQLIFHIVFWLLQTDKAVMSMEADDEGILAKILVKEGVDGVQVCLKTLYV